jgi:hypothetical protein
MSDVFISYSRQDSNLVEPLVNDLRAAGLEIWIDKAGLKPGTPDWDQEVRKAIYASSAVLLAASPSSCQSTYVKDEISLAQRYNIPVYPVWIDGDQWIDSIPLGLVSIRKLSGA